MSQTTEWSDKGRGGIDAAAVHTKAELINQPRRDGETMAEFAHDARNLVTALGLYCDLLDEPGVLATPFIHYGNELRLVAAASRRLVEKLVTFAARETNEIPAFRIGPPDPVKRPVQSATESRGGHEGRARPAQRWDLMPAVPIDNLAGELMANRNLLAALAGPTIALTVETEGGALPVGLNGEDLTQVLVNLIKNAAEAMPAGGKINIRLREQSSSASTPRAMLLTIEDSGRGIAPKAIDRIFEAGFTTQSKSLNETGWPATHRGLGLSITRSIIEAAGGRIQAKNRETSGACMELELPVRTR